MDTEAKSVALAIEASGMTNVLCPQARGEPVLRRQQHAHARAPNERGLRRSCAVSTPVASARF